MRTAELRIDQTSDTCIRYTLVCEGAIIWRNRIAPTSEGHKGARERMAAWALRHDVVVQEAETSRPKQTIIPGRYGRH